MRLESPELPVEVNPAKPRRGSFEVTLLRPDGSSESGPGSRREALVPDRGHLGIWGTCWCIPK